MVTDCPAAAGAVIVVLILGELLPALYDTDPDCPGVLLKVGTEGNPVPHYWEHVQWVFNKHSIEEFMEWAPNMTLEGVVDKITVPFLITHGEDDKQIPIEFAMPQYENAVHSPKREFHLFTKDEGGSAHAGADNEAIGASFISDWVNEHL